MGKFLSIISAVFIGIAVAETPIVESNIFGPIDAESRIDPKIEISIVSPDGIIYFGDEVTLACLVDGMEGMDYTLDWQYCVNEEDGDFIDLDCHEPLYTFVITRENVHYCYRVVISQK